jgi:hypothetical protein
MLMSRSSTGMQLDSVVMSSDGSVYWAEVDSVTWCSFAADDATMGSDTTASTSIVAEDLRDDSPLVRTSHGLATIDAHGLTTPYWTSDASLVAGRYIEGGAVALTEAGDIRFFDGAAETRVVHAGDCASIDVDHDAGAAWAACGRNVIRVTVDDTVAVPADDAELVSWSDSAATAVFVESDRTSLTAISETGDVLWTATAEEPIVEITAVAGTPYFAALVETDEGNGVALLSADDGSQVDLLGVDGLHVRGAADASRIVVYGGWSSQVLDVIE